ncbi:MAG: AMP-binding protein [Odoribacter sp.]|nr:AMP-binding protein [Odoribacter sp.]
MMYVVQTGRFKTLADLQGVPEGEVLSFLKEWFDEKDYVCGHTSGSTGTPKEIRLGKTDMRASARITNDFLGIGKDSVLLLCLSVSYIAGKMLVVRALEAGAKLVVCDVSSRPLGDLAYAGQVDLAAMVPMQVEESLKHPEDEAKLCVIRQLLIGGAPVSDMLEKRLQSLPVSCYATYGMTETVSHVALRRLNVSDVYFALGEVSFSLDDRNCLVVHAPHLQAREFVTNDLAELVDSRHFKWVGRYDHVINSGGIKFSPEVLESKIGACISSRYFITSLPDERLGQRIVLAVEGERQEERERQWLATLRKVLTAYELPREIVYLARFEETASGKVIRRLGGSQD